MCTSESFIPYSYSNLCLQNFTPHFYWFFFGVRWRKVSLTSAWKFLRSCSPTDIYYTESGHWTFRSNWTLAGDVLQKETFVFRYQPGLHVATDVVDSLRHVRSPPSHAAVTCGVCMQRQAVAVQRCAAAARRPIRAGRLRDRLARGSATAAAADAAREPARLGNTDSRTTPDVDFDR